MFRASQRLLIVSSKRAWHTRNQQRLIFSSLFPSGSQASSNNLPFLSPDKNRHHHATTNDDARRLNALPVISVRSFSVAAQDDDDDKDTKRGDDDDDGVAAAAAAKTKPTTTFRQRAKEGASKAGRAGRRGAKTVAGMMRQYGPVFVGTYFCVYVGTLASLFVGVDSGLLDPVKLMSLLSSSDVSCSEEGTTTVHLVVEYLEHYSWSKPYASIVEKNPHVANLAVAWVLVKFTEPVRLMFTLAVVPKLARHFGFVKVVDDKEKHTDEADGIENEMEADDSKKQEVVEESTNESDRTKKDT